MNTRDLTEVLMRERGLLWDDLKGAAGHATACRGLSAQLEKQEYPEIDARSGTDAEFGTAPIRFPQGGKQANLLK